MKIRLLFTLVFTVVTALAKTPYPGYDSEHGPVSTDGYIAYIASYTGNVHVATHDLTVAGAVGRHGLSWRRFGNSRTTGATLWFGRGHNWSHNWQWELADAGLDEQGRAVLVVREPEGFVHRFVETAAGQWQPEAAISQEIVSEGSTFRLLISGGSEVHFVRTGSAKKAVYQLQALLDELGNRWTFEWHKGRLVQINEPAGRWLKISYATIGAPTTGRGAGATAVISQVSGSDGQVVNYVYEVQGGVDYPVLSDVTYPDATHATYAYVAPRMGDRLLLEQADDPRGSREMRGRAIRYRTEPEAAEGQVARVERADGKGVFDVLSADSQESRGYSLKLPNGGSIGNFYYPGGYSAEEVDANGFVKKHTYSAGKRGFKTATTDALGQVTQFENDAKGNVVRTIYPDGSTKSWQRDARGRVLVETDELGRTRRYTRDQLGRITRMLHPDGSAEEATYNNFGQILTRRDRGGAVTTFVYDARGLLTKTTNALGATTTFTYDANDRLKAITDARGNTTQHEYDAAGRVARTIFPDLSTTSVLYDSFGQVIKTTDSAGSVHRTTFDEFGRRLSTIDALGQETRFEYGPVGGIAPWAAPVRSISPTGRVVAVSYDAAGRVIARTLAAGTPQEVTTRMAYDAEGRLISVTNPLGGMVRFFYDKRGRRIKTESALNHATSITYDAAGQKLSETDGKGNTTYWTYDSMGRQLTRTDAKGQVTRSEYDAAGRLAKLTDAKLNAYRFEYDVLGWRTGMEYADGSRETTAYDESGLKVRHTNRAGAVQTFAYDNRGREIRSEWSDGSQTIVKAYDPAGRLALEDNGVSKLTFTYDASGRLTSETQDLSPTVTGGVSDPIERTIGYAYNADGLRDKVMYSDGRTISYTYTALGQIEDIFDDREASIIASYEYDAGGNPKLMPRENGTVTLNEFDVEHNPLAITERANDRRNPLSEIEYSYDESGNRTMSIASAYVDSDGEGSRTLDSYRYDETYQITGADYGAAFEGDSFGAPALEQDFTYDAVGNRITVTRSARNGLPVIARYTTNNLNQYTQVGEFTPTSDRNGNLSGFGEWLYRYDAINRLVSASNGQISVRYFYDAKNRCVARSNQSYGSAHGASSTALRINVYDNWNLIEESNAAGEITARYVHGNKIDGVILIVNKHGRFYPHYDALGSVTMLTGEDGRMVERYTYSVTGEVTIMDRDGTTLTDSAVGNRWTFTGRERLPELGLYDYRNRLYSPTMGRFMQTDPIMFNAGDVNVYRYVGNRMSMLVDPFGLGEIKTYLTVNPQNGVMHATLYGKYDNGTEFAIGYYPGSTGNGEVKNDLSRIQSAAPTESWTATDQEVRAAAMGLRQYGIDNDYDLIQDNCGAAVDSGIAASGKSSSQDYEDRTIATTFLIWGFNSMAAIWSFAVGE